MIIDNLKITIILVLLVILIIGIGIKESAIHGIGSIVVGHPLGVVGNARLYCRYSIIVFRIDRNEIHAGERIIAYMGKICVYKSIPGIILCDVKEVGTISIK